jgi:hypothetical protein
MSDLLNPDSIKQRAIELARQQRDEILSNGDNPSYALAEAFVADRIERATSDWDSPKKFGDTVVVDDLQDCDCVPVMLSLPDGFWSLEACMTFGKYLEAKYVYTPRI